MMKFKGLHKVSLIDYPGKICAIVFTGGCNFRCQYCHNPELVIGDDKLPDIPEAEILSFMQKRCTSRSKLLDGLCISGGEPTIWEELPKFMKTIKGIGLLVKLDTNGTNPDMIREVIGNGSVDYIAMDIKGTPERYPQIVGQGFSLTKIQTSIELLLQNKIDYEFRTTVFPEFFTEEEAKQISKWVKGAKRYVLQKPHIEKTLNGKFHQKIRLYGEQELINLAKLLPNCIVRL
ncbi:MAG: anaerobic ribonucleoside-triphosphate reductase activating protein [Candidatus Stahlbacteria bacterium]|nr:anaerobic ribonucleoside-triphosphate reductase activating protein [Candidatus Stahlbacteria bacterium]